MNILCTVCKQNIPRCKFSRHGKQHRDIQCQICGKQFLHLNIYIGHMLVAHQNSTLNQFIEYNLYKLETFCEICSKSLGTKRRLRDHLISKHNSVPCPVCAYRIGGYSMIKAHFLSVHIKGYFQCDKCDSMQRTANTYIKHMKNAHQTVVTLCWTCAKFFEGQDEFNSHIANVHPMGDLMGDMKATEASI